MTELVDPQLAAWEAQDPATFLEQDTPPPIPPTRQPRTRHDVERDLAVAFVVLAGLMVRQLLQDRPFDPADSAEVARGHWRTLLPMWVRLAGPAILHAYRLGATGSLTDDEIAELAQLHLEELGEYISSTSADALSDGVHLQLNQKWSYELAWRRAASAYGLDGVQMRTYVNSVMGASEGSTAPIPETGRSLAEKLLLRRAERLGREEPYTAEQSGKALGWMFLAQQGRLAGATKSWRLGGDEQHCAVCQLLAKQVVTPDRPFVLPDGSEVWSPRVHPGCECGIELHGPDGTVIAKADRIDVAGIALLAEDTGRVLMLQRAQDDDDPAGGTWEFPGGHIEKGEVPLDAGKREWEEEVRRLLPSNGRVLGSWRSGIYQGFVVAVPDESAVPSHTRGRVANPDDPDGDQVEAVAWWEIKHLPRNPAIRQELRDSLPAFRDACSESRNADRVTKRFDPAERRDSHGQWARTEGPLEEMARELNASKSQYEDNMWRAYIGGPAEQVKERKDFEQRWGRHGKLLAAAVEDWVGMDGVSRARHVEHGTREHNPITRLQSRRFEAGHRLLIDTLDAAPPSTVKLYRGGSFEDVSELQRGNTLNLPISSFSATPAGATRFAWKGWLQRKQQPVVFELDPGARALNLTPLTTHGVSPNEWISRGQFKVVSSRHVTMPIKWDPAEPDSKAKDHDVLLVRLRQVRPVSKAYRDDPYDRDQHGRFASHEGRRSQVQVLDRPSPAIDNGLYAMLQTIQRAQEAPAATPAPLTGHQGLTRGGRPSALTSGKALTEQRSLTRTAPLTTTEGLTGLTQKLRQEQQQGMTLRLHLALRAPVVAEAPPDTQTGTALYVGVSDISAYFDYLFDGAVGAYGNDVNFEDVEDFHRTGLEDYGLKNEPRFQTSAVRRAQGWSANPSQLEWISQDEWEELLGRAKMVWDASLDNVDYALEHLEDGELREISDWALRGDQARPADIRADIARSIRMEGHDDVRNLRLAYADYMTWKRPDLLGDVALADGSTPEDFNGYLSTLADREVLDYPPPMAFRIPELAKGDTPERLRGKYAIGSSVYRSALDEMDKGAELPPPGHLGTRDLILEPDDLSQH